MTCKEQGKRIVVYRVDKTPAQHFHSLLQYCVEIELLVLDFISAAAITSRLELSALKPLWQLYTTMMSEYGNTNLTIQNMQA